MKIPERLEITKESIIEMKMQIENIGKDKKEENEQESLATETDMNIKELYQRVTLFAKKTGIIGKNKQFDSAGFLNKQIETLYIFIENIIIRK